MSRYFRYLTLLCVLSLALLTGCAVHLIMDYDPVLDQSISAVQASTEQFLSQLDAEVGTPAASYSNNQSFYVTTDAQLRTLATRAQSEPKSKIVVQQVTELEASFTDMQKLHQLDGDKGLGHLEITTVRSGLENEFVSMLTLQLALKNRLSTPATAAMAPTVTQ